MDLLRSVKRRMSTKNQQSFHETFELGQVLGEGAFAQVRLGRCRHSKEEAAIKIFDVRKPFSSSIDYNLAECIKEEVALTKDVSNHPNCVQLIGFFAERNLHYMVMEKCRCSWLDVMRDQPNMVETQLVSIFQQALLGLSHCHAARVVHRDVKPENYLFGGECGNVVKLCDFGLAISLPKKGYVKGVSGTAPYMSPELLAGHGYDCKTDVWSFAVVVYLMLTGHYPYEPKIRNASEMKKVILLGKPTPHFGQDEPGTFASDLLKRDPQVRSTAWEALQHEFLKPKPTLRRSWTAETLAPAAKLAKAVSREFKGPADPGRTKDLNDLLDDLQERGEQFYLGDKSLAEEQCDIAADEATEGHMMELILKHSSAEKVGWKLLSLPRGPAPWCGDSEFGTRSTQVPTCDTLPPLDLVSEASDAPQEEDEDDMFNNEKPVVDIWNPTLWTV